MARFNEILAGRFNRALQKLTGIKGMASTPQLGTEVIPSFTFPLGVEFRYLESWQRYRQFVTSGPVAAVVSAVRFRNPPGSNVVAVIESVHYYANNTDAFGQINLNRGTDTGNLDTTAGLAGPSQREDPRGQTNSTITLSINSVAIVALTNATLIHVATTPVGTTFLNLIEDDNMEILCMPGDSLQWSQAAAVNQALRVGICWRERFLEESERT